jgi:hypothetical protein
MNFFFTTEDTEETKPQMNAAERRYSAGFWLTTCHLSLITPSLLAYPQRSMAGPEFDFSV